MAQSKLTWSDKAELFASVAKIGVYVLGENIFPRKARTANDVPRSYEHITTEWLNAVLCKNIPGGKILAFETTGGSVGTSSRQGLRLSLNAEAKAAGLPERMFTKATPKYTQRLLMGLPQTIWGEVAFYNDLRKGLDIEAPVGYYAGVDPASLRSMVIMGDIAVSKGANFISTETLITKPLIETLLGDMGKYHARYWNDARLGRDFPMMPLSTGRWHLVNKFIGMKERSAVGAKRAQPVIPAALHGREDELWRATDASFGLNAAMPTTLLHGDLHVGQTYITNEGRLGIGDWQATMRGGWAFDFAYLVTSALTVENRRAWEKDLLRFYLDALHAAGGPQLAFDDAWTCYRQHTLWPYIVWLYTIGYGPLQPKMQPDNVCMDIVERTANAVNDHDGLRSVG